MGRVTKFVEGRAAPQCSTTGFSLLRREMQAMPPPSPATGYRLINAMEIKFPKRKTGLIAALPPTVTEYYVMHE